MSIIAIVAGITFIAAKQFHITGKIKNSTWSTIFMVVSSSLSLYLDLIDISSSERIRYWEERRRDGIWGWWFVSPSLLPMLAYHLLRFLFCFRLVWLVAGQDCKGSSWKSISASQGRGKNRCLWSGFTGLWGERERKGDCAKDETDEQAFLMLQGAKAVKEELLDDIIKESGQYRPPGNFLAWRDDCSRTFSDTCQILAIKLVWCVRSNLPQMSPSAIRAEVCNYFKWMWHHVQNPSHLPVNHVFTMEFSGQASDAWKLCGWSWYRFFYLHTYPVKSACDVS